MTEEDSDRRARIAVAGLMFAVSAPVTYALERLYERLRAGPHNMQLILSEPKAGFYWRATIAVWLAGLMAMLAFRYLRTDASAWPRLVTRLTWALLALMPIALLWTVRFP